MFDYKNVIVDLKIKRDANRYNGAGISFFMYHIIQFLI